MQAERRWRGLLPVALLAIVGCLNHGPAGGAELSDSGWAFGRPSVLGEESGPADPSLQITISNALQQTRISPLTESAPRAKGEARQEPGEGETTKAGNKEIGAMSPHLADRRGGRDSTATVAASPGGPALSWTAKTETPKVGSTGDGDRPSTSQANVLPPSQSVAESQAADDESGTTAAPRGTREPAAAIPAGEQLAAEPAADGRDANKQAPDVADGDAPQSKPAVEVALPPLSRQMMGLRAKLRTVLKSYYRYPLNTRDSTPWEVMHAMLAYELQSRVLQGGPRGTPITSIGWLCYNKPCKGQQMLRLTPEGEVRAMYGVGLEGHSGQFLSMLAQCNVSPDYPIIVNNHEFTVQDLVAVEQKTCYGNTELSFKLTGLTHYVDLDATWVNDKGEPWDSRRLIREELAQPINNSIACGGTHRLMGLSRAVNARRRQGKPLDGEYAQAAERVEQYQQYAFRLQNRDGSLSTEWFRGPGDERDIDRRVKTTGHLLEWLAYSLTDAQLRDGRTVRAMSYLTNLLYSNYDNEWDTGAVSHAIHALVLYDKRVFQPYDRQQGVASSTKDKAATRTRTRSQSTHW
jgi:hypothetical protein